MPNESTASYYNKGSMGSQLHNRRARIAIPERFLVLE
jgi:hypothetical protein